MGLVKKLIITIHTRISKLKVSSKIMLIYGLVIFFSISLSSIIYQKVYYSIMFNNIRELSIENLNSLSSNIDDLIDNADNLSTIILSDPVVQNSLTNSISDAQSHFKMVYCIRRIMGISRNISSIFILDNYEGRTFTSKSQESNRLLQIDYPNKVKWYKDVSDKKGGMIIKLNGGGVFQKNGEKTYLSCMRIINNIESQRPIGMIIINISESDILKAFGKIRSQTKLDIILRDENGENIISSPDTQHDQISTFISENKNSPQSFKIVDINNKKHLLSYSRLERYNWELATVISFNELPKESTLGGLIFLIIILVNGIIIFVASVMVAHNITHPIDLLVMSMEENERSGQLKETCFTSSFVEFNELRDGYNRMIGQINKLIERVIFEQKTKRKAELEVLHAQIKPHFLYNTFDTISSLALMGKNQDVCKALTALGQYYRTSLSKGKELITVEEEIETAKNYLSIQEIRYDGMFSAEFDIDGQANKYKVLKLILQPLIENALYHGIKPQGEPGIIRVSVHLTNNEIIMTVADDGVGMPEDFIGRVLDDSRLASSSFGLRGTIERLRIFYDKKDIVRIDSILGKGTKIIISIPIEEGQSGQQYA